MTERSLLQYDGITLQELANKLLSDHYTPIENLNAGVNARTAHLYTTCLTEEGLHLMTLIDGITGEIQKYTDHRKQIIIPYLSELIEKNVTGHNCMQCSGRCDMQHTTKVMELTRSIQDARATMYRINDIITRHDTADKEFKDVLSDVESMERLFNDTLHIEEELLLEKIIGAQRNIHAGS